MLRAARQDCPRETLQGHDGAGRGRPGDHGRRRKKGRRCRRPRADGAAQRVEHYEISTYTTAKNLAQQLRHSAVVALLSKSLAEEENSDQLFNQVARSLMSVAKMPAAIEHVE
jgi:hypothetical protein